MKIRKKETETYHNSKKTRNFKLLRKNGIIILHRNKTTMERLPNNFKLVEERIYGVSKIIFGKLLQ